MKVSTFPPAEATTRDSLFDWIEGRPHFRGIPVKRDRVTVAGREFTLARLDDPAALLDHPVFAERFLEDNQAPYGLELWPSSLMLAELILQESAGRRRRAVDLGCGLGLVSIAAAQAGWHITATDNEATSLRFTEYNAGINHTVIDAIEPLDWHDPPTHKVGLPTDRRFDRVFGSDLLYERVNHAPLLGCIGELLAPDGVALIVDPNRSIADGFEALAQDHGFDVTVSPTTKQTVDDCEATGRLFRLRRG